MGAPASIRGHEIFLRGRVLISGGRQGCFHIDVGGGVLTKKAQNVKGV